MTDEDLKLYRGVAKERDRLRESVRYLLSVLKYQENATGEGPDEEDAAAIQQISDDLEAVS
mgnify:CR=1 FL=1